MTPFLFSTNYETLPAAHACRIVVPTDETQSFCLRVEGPRDRLAATAAEVGIPYIEKFSLALCADIRPVQVRLDAAPVETAPGNWSVRSFDFESLAWVAGLRSRSACEFRSRYGARRFYVRMRRARLVRLPKRDAVYAAASLRDVTLAKYDASCATLSVPAAAPLPELYARAACLCSGKPAAFSSGRFIYKNIAPDVAAVLLVAAGQRYPARERRLPEATNDR